MVSKHLSIRILLCSLLCLLGPVQAMAAEITARVDRSRVAEGESITLNLEVNGSADGTPDFTPLEKDFDILSRNKSSSMQIINGKVSSKNSWVLMLMPKHKGQLSIPALDFGADRSNPLTITVSDAQTSQPGNTAEDLFLHVEVDPKQAYVQAQVIYTIQVYIDVNINNASLSEPALSAADAVVKKLGEDRRFEKQHQGRHYQVVERRYAIFPQQSGRLTISPVVFNAQVLSNNRPRHFFDPFPQSSQTKRIQSRAIELDVKPIPADHQGKAWLPARNVQIEESWPEEPPKFKVGEAVTRTITLGAEGLTAAQLPAISMDTPDGFKAYPDQPVLDDQPRDNGVIGIRQEKIALIATRPGSYELPEITISWWNTTTQQTELARIAKRRITVLAADGTTQQPSQPDTNTAVDTAKDEAMASLPTPTGTAGFWPWLSLGLGLGWLMTLAAWVYYHQQAKTRPITPPRQAQTQRQASLKQALKQVQQACSHNDALACKQALLYWAKLRYPNDTPTSLAGLGQRLGSNLQPHIDELHQRLYSPSAKTWQGQALWQALQKADKAIDQVDTATPSPLAPLYP